jgi:hypothetical protein
MIAGGIMACALHAGQGPPPALLTPRGTKSVIYVLQPPLHRERLSAKTAHDCGVYSMWVSLFRIIAPLGAALLSGTYYFVLLRGTCDHTLAGVRFEGPQVSYRNEG